ncbi:MAG: aspartate aminotransferase family protein [Candidatus Binatia bacterium]
MTAAATVVGLTDRFMVGNYARFPVAFVRGEGRRLWDESGKRYLDFFSGLGVSSLGHGHPGLVAAIRDQATKLLHASNLYYQEPAALLARELVERSFADRVFFCNSGTEAVEAAIKMARRADPDRHEIVATLGSFHGRTLGALAATGQPALKEGFGPLPGGFVHVPFDDVAAMDAAVGPRTAAVIVEPILGEGGVVVPDPGYLPALREVCDRAGALLVIDEVQTGVGRTGKFYAHEIFGVSPDIVASAKGLAGGLPIGAVLATESACSALVPGSHGSTFGANPLVCRAALAVLESFDDEAILDNCVVQGRRLMAGLEELCGGRDDIVALRGLGLMIGVEFACSTRPLVLAALDRGLILNSTAGNVLRFLPPLNVTEDEIDEGLEMLATVLEEGYSDEA